MRLAWRGFRYWMTLYRRIWIASSVITIANPVLFLVGIGVGLNHVVHHTGTLGHTSYLAFFAPGMLAAAAMQNGIGEGGFPVALAKTKSGNYRLAAATPLTTDAILYGHLLYVLLQVTIAATAFTAVMVAFGAAQSPMVLLALPAAVLTGFAFAVPVAAWAVTTPGPERVGALFKWVVMPLYLFSGTFFPIDQLPFWIRPAAFVTPLWQGVQLCRSLSLGTASTGPVLGHTAYLVALAAVGLFFARRNYKKTLHS